MRTPKKEGPAIPTLDHLLEKAPAKYSVVIFAGTTTLSPAVMLHITRLLKTGVKVHLVTAREPVLSALADFTDAKLLRLYIPKKTFKHPEPCIYLDGNYDEALFKQLDQQCPAFNHAQFAIEHAHPTAQLGIKAGAGTGKTATMVQRVLFLLHMATPALSPREIVMITFTREATHEMRQRLRQELVTRYRLTGKAHYLTWLEEVGDMPVKTIHAYTRELIVRLGSVRGHSQDLNIRQFQLERKQILEALVNEHLPPGETVKSVLQVPLYEFIDTANRFWEEMENKGLSLREMSNLQWGAAEAPADGIQALLRVILPEAEQRLARLKQERDALSLKDLTREVDALRPAVTDLPLHLSPVPRYLFIDEFQDTDNTQIKLVAWLQQQLKLHLFVVGDIKQSIYRFRGANYTAFDELEKQLPPTAKLQFHRLTKNYRTGANLLDAMHPYFARWADDKLLEYMAGDRLTGVVEGGQQIKFRNVTNKTRNGVILGMIRDTLADLPPDDPKARVALLVRSNAQARAIRDLCKEHDIECEVDAGGEFWKCEPVTDFFHLVSALLFPDDVAARLNLHTSPYSSREIPWAELMHLGGNQEELVKLLDQHPPHDKWSDWLEQLRLRPVLAVMRSIIDWARPEVRVYQRDRDETKAAEYSRNLGKLLLTLQETFPSRTISLHAIYRFIALKRATDREEDLADAQSPVNRVRLLCQTVHKAKGKQYHTVILPFTGQPFRVNSDEELLLEPPDKKRPEWRAGWRIKDERGRDIASEQYDQMVDDEVLETAREEARLLYVAMTRAQQRLWVARSQNPDPCWAKLLPERT